MLSTLGHVVVHSASDTSRPQPPGGRPARRYGWPGRGPRPWWPLLAVAAVPLTTVGLSGVGDAPDPHLAADRIAAWFPAHRGDIVTAAPFGYLAVVVMALFAVRLTRSMPPGPATAVRVGMAIVSGYMAFLHLVYTTLAYGGEATGLFVATILAVPIYAIGVALVLGGTARSALLPRWLTTLSTVGAVVVVPALVGYGDRGPLSPDVQQQVVANVFLAWALLVGIALFRLGAGGRTAPQ